MDKSGHGKATGKTQEGQHGLRVVNGGWWGGAWLEGVVMDGRDEEGENWGQEEE